VRTPYRAAALLALVFTAFGGPVYAATGHETIAQAPAAQSSLSGTITDSRGNPLSGVQISAEGAGHTYSATTDGAGKFRIVVPPGLYSVTIARGGFQTVQNDVSVVAGSSNAITVALQEQNLSSLRVIGRVSTSVARAPFNASESTVNVLPPVEIQLRQNPNLTDIVTTLPGVVATRTFTATPNTSFAVRGAPLQTRVTIDGHPISSGISGQWNTNYALSTMFADAEVVKGTGLNGSIAGESAVGTVNLRTRDFTRNNAAGLQWGTDSYGSGQYNVWADVNFLPGNRASLIVQKGFMSSNGPWNDQFKDRIGTSNLASQPRGTLQVPSFIGIDQWAGDFSNRYALEGELVKGRYRFSETTSVTLEFLGLQGQYLPQGGAYAAYGGQMTLQACTNGSGASLTYSASLAGCGLTSAYTAPYTFGRVGGTYDAYTWFPNSYIQNNEPQYAAEFRTSYKNDTILLRPYTHLINRYISGTFENAYPGNNGQWFVVTNPANCQVTFVAPTAGGGAKGPCFPVTMTPNNPAYIGGDNTSHKFATTPSAPVCSPTPPYTCFTTPTAVQNDGVTAFGTPFSQPELDRLNGYTFSYIHPAGNNIYNFSYDYRKDFAQSQSGDQSAAAPGCTYVIGTVTNNGNVAKTAQPTCTLPGTSGPCPNAAGGFPAPLPCSLPRSAINTPPTVTQYADVALTGTFQINPKLRVALGNYWERYQVNAQIENPAVLAAYFAQYNSTAAAPVALVPRTATYTHYDPHVGVEFRPSSWTSLRFNGGSSITQPYPALVSGFGAVTIPNAANGGNYTNSIPNFSLQPETTVSYDLGLDQRLSDGGVLSVDAYDFTVHNVFLSNNTTLPAIPNTCGTIGGVPQNAGFPNSLCLQTNTINGPIQRSYGLEIQANKTPASGWGYFLGASLQRTYLDQLPSSIYIANTSNGNVNFNINGEQLFGHPFFKSYGQLLFGTARGDVFELGADYEGANNFTFGPPYTIWDASARIRVHPHVRLLVSAQNLFNLNTGTYLGRSLTNQGFFQAGLYQVNGQLLYSQGLTNLNALPPRNIRVLLDVTP
jgi:outer membrane receptor protein involved in Fe transport